MSLPVLTVVGALGRQGASVVSAFTSSEKLQYHVRALTSNVESPAAKELATRPNVSVVAVDLNFVDSIVSALAGSTLLFANTQFSPAVFTKSGPKATEELEAAQGLNIVHAAAKTPTLKHLIWSTLPDGLSQTGGKLHVPHFQSKIPAQRFIESAESGLADKATFLQVGLYGSMIAHPPYNPIHVGAAEARILVLPIRANSLIFFAGDETHNVGIFSKAIFEQPEKTIGQTVNCFAEMSTGRDWAKSLENVLRTQGKNTRVVFMEATLDDFERLWGPLGLEIGLMYKYMDYTDDLKAWLGRALTAEDLGITGLLKNNQDAAAQIEW